MKPASSIVQVSASALLLSASVLTIYLHSYHCKRIDKQKENQVISYIRDRFRIPSKTQISIVGDHLLNDSCTHEITLSSSVWQERRSVYLSADQNYLFPFASDLRDNPHSISAARGAPSLPFAPLADIPAPTRGKMNAPVVLVEFSDFECPFCARFADVMKNDLSESDRDKVKVEFHYFPLSFHPWAERAAEEAYCVARQSPATFWKLHDYLFSHQNDIRNETLDADINAFLSTDKSIDQKAFSTCSHSDYAKQAVTADVALGTKYGVSGTPTIFLNGLRIVGAQSAADVSKDIDEAISHPAKAVEAP